MMKIGLSFLLLVTITCSAWGAPINTVAYASVGPNVIDFSDVAGAPFPGTNYNAVFASGGARFAERFVGQALSFNGELDVLSGTPSGPLSLQVGAAGQNLAIGTDTGTNGLYPYGPTGFPTPNGYGEGSFAVLFSSPISQFGLQLFFGGASDTFLQFFRADGSLISAVTVNGIGGFGFAREGGLFDIAGVSVHTADAGGLGYDNLRYNTQPTTVPEPATLLLVGAGFIAAVRRYRRQR